MRPWLEISTRALVANARSLAQRVAPAALCGVVKSNGYGHGLVPVSEALVAAQISGLRVGVFTAAEGLALREAAIRVPIMVLGPLSDSEIRDAIATDLECAILDEDDVARFPRSAAVHVKVDTGVGRFGGRPTAAAGLLERCAAAGLSIRGIYSHLANAEDLDDRLTTKQLEKLLTVPCPEGAMRHIAASAAAIMWPQTRLDMVRCGIALYGHWPSDSVQSAGASSGFTLERSLRWFAPVVQVREIDAGATVGYGCEFVAPRQSTIAVLPLGYADGLPRAAGGSNLLVKLAAERAPIVGRICMNACMVDVTGLRVRPRRGDVVEIDVEEVAAAAGTIAYEILARLPESLERRYT